MLRQRDRHLVQKNPGQSAHFLHLCPLFWKRLSSVFLLAGLCIWVLVSPVSPVWAGQYLIDPGLRENRLGVSSSQRLFRVTDEVETTVGAFTTQPAHWHVVSGITAPVCLDEHCPAPPREVILSKRTNCLGTCSDGLWQIQSPFHTVRYMPVRVLKRGMLQLRQRAKTRPDSRFGCQETNLFVGTNRVSPPIGMIPVENRSSLAQIQTLNVSFFHEVEKVRIGTACQNNFALTMVVIQLQHATDPVLFNYQIVSYDSLKARYTGLSWALQTPDAQTVSARGISDDVDLYGLERPEPGQAGRLYTVNILDRLKRILSFGSHRLDRNLMNWKVAGFYSGSFLYGQAEIVSKHGLFSVSDDSVLKQ